MAAEKKTAPSARNSGQKRNSPLENMHLIQGKGKNTPGFLRRRFPHLPWIRLPNLLTYARCLAIPLLVYLFHLPTAHLATVALFGAASLTDWFDGFLARRWECSTSFGAFLDPVADKLMVSTVLVLLSSRYGPSLAIPSSLIVGREIAVSALREWMATRGASNAVKVGWQGKCKTALTMVALTLLLLAPPFETTASAASLQWCLPLGLFLTYAATLLTLSSGLVYFRAAAPLLFQED
jgi:CDP-diacylglycerol--glycerol-3-phosphate 3-phosphatidyltransferase